MRLHGAFHKAFGNTKAKLLCGNGGQAFTSDWSTTNETHLCHHLWDLIKVGYAARSWSVTSTPRINSWYIRWIGVVGTSHWPEWPFRRRRTHESGDHIAVHTSWWHPWTALQCVSGKSKPGVPCLPQRNYQPLVLYHTLARHLHPRYSADLQCTSAPILGHGTVRLLPYALAWELQSPWCHANSSVGSQRR